MDAAAATPAIVPAGSNSRALKELELMFPAAMTRSDWLSRLSSTCLFLCEMLDAYMSLPDTFFFSIETAANDAPLR